MSQAGVLSTSGSSSTDNVLIFEASPQINFKVAGATTVFTTPSNKRFMMVGYTVLADSVVNYVDPATFDLGFNGPAYDNMGQGIGFDLNVTDGYESTMGTTSNNIPIVPVNTAVKVNVVGPATLTTTYLGRVFIHGFLI